MIISHSKDYLLRAGASATVVGVLALYIILVHEGDAQYYRLYYFLPAAIAATLFVFDRISRFRQLGIVLLAMDTIVGAVAFIRVTYPIPFYSGHALFLTYSLLTVKDRLCLLVTLIVLIQTIYLKVVVWNSDWTLYGGILIGWLIYLLHKRYLNSRNNESYSE